MVEKFTITIHSFAASAKPTLHQSFFSDIRHMTFSTIMRIEYSYLSVQINRSRLI